MDHIASAPKAGSKLSCLSAIAIDATPWPKICRIIDKIHKHICGYASFTDFKLLFDQNGLWHDAVKSYFGEVTERCTACHFTSYPQPNRTVSIRSSTTEFDEDLCIDHPYLDEIRSMLYMGLISRYFAAHVDNSAILKEAIIAFEACWVSQLWYPDSIRANNSFHCRVF